MAPARDEAGFTLVELLVALMLSMLLTLGTVASIRWGLRLAAAADDRHALVIERALARDMLRRELARARPLLLPAADGGRRVAFAGREMALAFAAAAPAELGAELRWLVLEREPVAGGGRLVLRHLPIEAAAGTGPAVVLETSPLLDHVDAVALSYLARADIRGPGGWRATWDDPRELPALIRIELRFTRRPEVAWPPLLVRPMVDARPTPRR
jgi:general secretion pathway protein J